MLNDGEKKLIDSNYSNFEPVWRERKVAGGSEAGGGNGESE